MTLDRIAWFVGQISRPLSILVATIGATVAAIITALRVENGTDGALLMAAIGAYAGGLFGLKAVEVWKGTKDAASVEIAKAGTSTPGPQEVTVVNTAADAIPVEETKP